MHENYQYNMPYINKEANYSHLNHVGKAFDKIQYYFTMKQNKMQYIKFISPNPTIITQVRS